MREIWEYLVTIDGCPYAFGSAGLSALPTALTGFESDFSSAWTLIQGGLVEELPSWTERSAPLDGTVEVDGISIRLHDAIASSGPASGYRVLTWLASRNLVSITQQLLAASISASDTSITVDAAGDFGTGSQVIWIEREAILCSGRGGTTFSVTTRGYYGTRAAAHSVQSDQIYYPVIYGAIPSLARRKVIFWRVTDGTAYPLWRGYIQRAPRLSSDGVSWELQCDHAWTVTQEETLGAGAISTETRGVNALGIETTISYPGGSAGYWAVRGVRAKQYPVYRDLQSALKEHETDVRAAIGEAGHADKYRVSHDLAGGGVTLSVSSTGAGALSCGLTIGAEGASADAPQTSDPRSVSITLPTQPSTLVLLRRLYTDEALPLSDVSLFPSAPLSTSTTDAVQSTYVRQVLLSELDDDSTLVFYADSITDDYASLSGGGPAAVGTWTIASTSTGRDQYDGMAGASLLGDPSTAYVTMLGARKVRLGLEIDTSHLVHGIRYGVLSSLASTTLDQRDWDWDDADAIAARTEGLGTSRRWYLDGSQTMAGLLDGLRAHGIALGVRESLLVPFVVGAPLPTEDSASTVTTEDLIGLPSWSDGIDYLCNRVDLTTPFGRVIVQDQQSRAQYGETRTVEIDVTQTADRRLDEGDPTTVGLSFLRRLTGLWRHPPKVITFTVSLLRFARSLYLGDTVTVTEWLLPAGDGTRGLQAVQAQVISRTVDLAAGTLTIEALAYQVGRPAGYAPCCRVESRSGAVLTIATAYLSSTATDYAGSNLASYAEGEEGGVSRFAVGDKVRLITRNTTTLTQETGLVIQSIDAGAPSITLTTTPSTTITSALDYVDLIYDDYSTSSPTDSQKDYAWIADGVPAVIDGTTDKAKTWS